MERKKWMPEVSAENDGTGHRAYACHPDKGYYAQSGCSYWYVTFEGPDSFQRACDAAVRKCAELNAPPVPSVTDWFEECSAEEAVFRDGEGFSFLVCTQYEDGGACLDLFDGYATRQDALDAYLASNSRPVRPKAVRP